MIDFFLTSLLVFAVYRVSHMVSREDGPFDLFSMLREEVGQKTWIGRGLHCLWCISFWLSLVAALTLGKGVAWTVALWLGIAGMVVFLDKVSNG